MKNLNGELITFFAADGLRLKGYLALGESNLATIIHIHGNFGNFYENDFIPIMAEKYTAAGINFLCVNNRGHDGIAEAYHDGKLVYVGGAIELPEQCIYDIEGAVQFAERFSSRIILQGHSFGCLRTMAYLKQSQRALEFILLSPADTYALQSDYIYPETITTQIARITNQFADQMDTLLPSREFGIRHNDVEYHIPISARTFVALFSGSMPGLLRYDKPLDFYFDTKCFVYYGGKDVLWTEPRNVVENFFLTHVANLRFYYSEGGDHHFHGFESHVVGEVIKWVLEKHND